MGSEAFSGQTHRSPIRFAENASDPFFAPLMLVVTTPYVSGEKRVRPPFRRQAVARCH